MNSRQQLFLFFCIPTIAGSAASRFVFLIIPSAIGLAWQVGCQAIPTKELSPVYQTTVIEERGDSGETNYFIRDQATGKNVGYILPPGDEFRNVALVASWNHSRSKVAILEFYGTKQSCLLLFARGSDGVFKKIPLGSPDPEKLLIEQRNINIPRPGDGHDSNAVGPWIDDNTVSLVAGEGIQTEQSSDEYTYVFATFTAHVGTKRAKVSQVRLIGPLDDEDGDAFIKKWGDQYFSAHSRYAETNR